MTKPVTSQHCNENREGIAVWRCARCTSRILPYIEYLLLFTSTNIQSKTSFFSMNSLSHYAKVKHYSHHSEIDDLKVFFAHITLLSVDLCGALLSGCEPAQFKNQKATLSLLCYNSLFRMNDGVILLWVCVWCKWNSSRKQRRFFRMRCSKQSSG